MSCTKFHTGKLTSIETIEHHQEFINFACEKMLTDHHELSTKIYINYNYITYVTTEKSPILFSSNNTNELLIIVFIKM